MRVWETGSAENRGFGWNVSRKKGRRESDEEDGEALKGNTVFYFFLSTFRQSPLPFLPPCFYASWELSLKLLELLEKVLQVFTSLTHRTAFCALGAEVWLRVGGGKRRRSIRNKRVSKITRSTFAAEQGGANQGYRSMLK